MTKLLLYVDIVDVVAEKVSLKSKVNYIKIVSFHQEKSPSFLLTGLKAIINVLVAERRGNSVNFLMDYENIDFVTAVEYLAGK